jgi:hypothetical protein
MAYMTIRSTGPSCTHAWPGRRICVRGFVAVLIGPAPARAGGGPLRGQGDVRLGLEVEVGEHAVQPGGQPPVPAAEQGHRGGHQDHADDGRVDQDRGGQADAHHLQHQVPLGGEPEEDGDHDRGGCGDEPSGRGQAGDDAAPGVPGAQPLLSHPGEQEDLVVHRQAERDGEHQDRHPARHRHVVVEAEQTGAPAPGEDRDDDAVRGGDAQQVHERRLEGDDRGAEDHGQQQERQADDEPDHEPDPLGQQLGDVGERGRHAGDLGAVGQDVGPQALQQLGRRLVARTGRRLDDHQRGAAGRGELRPDRLGDPVRRGQLLHEGRQRGGRHSVEVDGHEERTVGARPEALGDQVVRLPSRAVGGLGARVGGPQAQVQRRHGEHEEQAERAERPGHWPATDPLGPPRGEGDGGAGRAAAAGPARQDAVTGEPEGGRHERQRRGGDGHDGERGRVAERRVRRQAGQAQAHQRHEDGGGGEDDRPAGGGGGPGRGSADVVPAAEELDVAADEQQRVVDADAEPDHRRDRRRGGAHVVTAASSRTPAEPTARPSTATRIGMPAASTEPNVSTSRPARR